MKNTYEAVYASDFEEFFYEDNDVSVSEGMLVGVDITIHHKGNPDQVPSTEVQFELLDGIYWAPPFHGDE